MRVATASQALTHVFRPISRGYFSVLLRWRRIRDWAKEERFYAAMLAISFSLGVFAAAFPTSVIAGNIHYSDIAGYSSRSGLMPDVEKFLGTFWLALVVDLFLAAFVCSRFSAWRRPLNIVAAYLCGFLAPVSLYIVFRGL